MNQSTSKEYTFEGQKFLVTKPEHCEMEAIHQSSGLKVTISVMEIGLYSARITGKIRNNEVQQTTGGDTPEAALQQAAKEIHRRLALPDMKELCQELDAFHDSL